MIEDAGREALVCYRVGGAGEAERDTGRGSGGEEEGGVCSVQSNRSFGGGLMGGGSAKRSHVLDIAGQVREEGRNVRVGFIGCGSHAFRNIFPTFQFLPVELVVTCDLRLEQAQAYARRFGARRAYQHHKDMLGREDLEAVFIVTNYDEEGRPRYPALATDCMEAGCHVWIEKPPAATGDEVRAMMEVAERTGRFVVVGFKKMFFPANVKASEIAHSEQFGQLQSVSLRYPQYIPAREEMRSLKDSRSLIGFLDHLCHPASILYLIAGRPRTLYYQRSAKGGGFAVFELSEGAVGALHFSAGQSGTSPLERTEIVGSGANVVVENSIRLIHYRPGHRGEGGYGRSTNFIGPDADAPIVWEPEFSLGQLYNKGLFLLGYYDEVKYFIDCILSDRVPEKSELRAALAITQIFEAFQKGPGKVVELPSD